MGKKQIQATYAKLFPGKQWPGAAEAERQIRSAGYISGKTQEQIDKANKPFKATQENIAQQSLASSNNNNTFQDASIAGQGKDFKLPSAKSPNVSETLEEAQKKIEPTPIPLEPQATEPQVSTVSTVSPAVTNDAEPAKPNSKYNLTIWDAYRNGAFGDPDSDEAKHNRDYYIIDAISNAARNMGQDQAAIAAAYGGGSYKPEYSQNKWDERVNELQAQNTSAEAANIEGSDKAVQRQVIGEQLESMDLAQQAQRINNASAADRQAAAQRYLKELEKLRVDGIIDQKKAQNLASVANMIQSGGVTQSAFDQILGAGLNAAGLFAKIL